LSYGDVNAAFKRKLLYSRARGVSTAAGRRIWPSGRRRRGARMGRRGKTHRLCGWFAPL